MWENIVWRSRPQMTIWHMRIACWISKATNTHTHTHRLCNTLCFSTATVVGCKKAPQRYGIRTTPVLFHTVHSCVLYGSENRDHFTVVYSLVSVMEMEWIYRAVRTDYLNIIQVNFRFSPCIITITFISRLNALNYTKLRG